ncbi:MAG: hypothetical protein VKM68_06230 [Cyanobacteriota bacterium]|jgi:hypothetical protein|nr:hypothetical protein [Synechococcus sp. Tobar2m-G35]MEB3239798.1 hypothetical protein [Cyanobacteriota bacterium]
MPLINLRLTGALLALACGSGLLAGTVPGRAEGYGPGRPDRPQLSREQQLKMISVQRTLLQRHHDGRLAILDNDERCLKAAADDRAAQACQQQEREALKRLRDDMRAQARTLRQQFNLPEPPERRMRLLDRGGASEGPGTL